MKMTFRWYGPDDPVTLKNIKQIPGLTGIVTALHDIPTGDVWTEEAIQMRKQIIESAGLSWDVIESIPLHEDIKRGLDTRDQYIENWIESLKAAGKSGIPIICYNFMPIMDWTRTNLAHELDDGSLTLTYVHEDLDKFNGSLPGWEEAYSPDELKAAIDAYKDIDEDTYWSHLKYFLDAVIPIAEEYGIKLAIHPDDPPFDLFGVKRIIKNIDSIKKLKSLNESHANGFTFCTGSYGILPQNDLPEMVKEAGDRIHFVHARNIIRTRVSDETVDFEEATHHIGDLDLSAVIKALVDIGFEGPIRPDHGRSIWDEEGKAGYWLHDRALGAQYLLGLEKAYRSMKKVA